jgi:hypothetical protein
MLVVTVPVVAIIPDCNSYLFAGTTRRYGHSDILPVMTSTLRHCKHWACVMRTKINIMRRYCNGYVLRVVTMPVMMAIVTSMRRHRHTYVVMVPVPVRRHGDCYVLCVVTMPLVMAIVSGM